MTPLSLRLPTSNVGITVTPNMVIGEMAFVGTVQRKGDVHAFLPSEQHPQPGENPALPSSLILWNLPCSHARTPEHRLDDCSVPSALGQEAMRSCQCRKGGPPCPLASTQAKWAQRERGQLPCTSCIHIWLLDARWPQAFQTLGKPQRLGAGLLS